MCRVGNSASVLWALPGASELSRENSQPLSVVATDARSHGYAVFIQCRTLDVRRIPGGHWEVVASLVFCDDSRVSGRAADKHTVHTYMGTLSKAARPVAVPSCKGGVETSHAEALAVPRVEAGCESMSPCSLRSGLKRRPSAVTVLAIHTRHRI